MRRYRIEERRFPLRETFRIARGAKTEAAVLRVVLEEGNLVARGECVPYARYGESLDSVRTALEELFAASPDIEREELQSRMPAGAARSALDCALWDLEAKRSGRRVHELLGLPAPRPMPTAFTISLGEPDAMEAAARRAAHRPILKTKLGGGDEDFQRIAAVRRGAPEAKIVIDANEGWTIQQYERFAPQFAELGVQVIEQPLPAGEDAALADVPHPVPVCADESSHDRSNLEELAPRYDMLNLKLDKAGGLTEALALQAAAREAGLALMVGCMVSSSLAMAPATLLAQGCELVDLDGALLLAEDEEPGLVYDEQGVHPATPALWG